MKRSALVRLVLIGSSPFTLSACGEEPQPAFVYATPEDCIRDGQMGADACREEYENAKLEHARTAPRYNDQADCESDFGTGACQVAPGYGRSFMPLMAGYLIGRMMAPKNDNCQDRSGDCSPRSGGASGYYRAFRSQPLYKARDDRETFRTANNTEVGRRSGYTYVDAEATRPGGSTLKPLSRGGFGRSAARGGSRFGFRFGG